MMTDVERPGWCGAGLTTADARAKGLPVAQKPAGKVRVILTDVLRPDRSTPKNRRDESRHEG
jgi:hypothetical protein